MKLSPLPSAVAMHFDNHVLGRHLHTEPPVLIGALRMPAVSNVVSSGKVLS